MGQAHAVTILRSVARGDQECRFVLASLPCTAFFNRDCDARRTKVCQDLHQRHHIASMAAQPARLLQGHAIDCGVEPGSGDTGEERGAGDLAFGLSEAAELRFHDARSHFLCVWPRTIGHKVKRLQRLALPGNGLFRCGVGLLLQRLDRTQVDVAGIAADDTKALPGCQRLLDILDADGLREVVGAAQRNDEGGNLFQHQPAQVTVNGAVAAEDECRVGLVGRVKFVSGKQIDARQLEGPDVMLLRVRSKQGDGAHRATFAQQRRKSKVFSPKSRRHHTTGFLRTVWKWSAFGYSMASRR